MSEIDTNEVRRWAHTFSDKTEAIKNLCDALDEARAELLATQRAKRENDERFQLAAGAQRERAEKAEAAIARVRNLCASNRAGYYFPHEIREALDDPS